MPTSHITCIVIDNKQEQY